MKLASLFALALSLVGQDKEKITLKWQPRQGDCITTVEKTTMELKLTANSQEFELSNKGSKKLVTTFLAVKDGKPTKVEYDYKEDIETSNEPGQMEAKEKENPLHGKKVTITEKDGKQVYEGVEGLDDKAMKKLHLEDHIVHMFPKKEISVGDSWEVTGDELKKAMDEEDFDEGKITFKLKEVKEINKVRCAVIDVKIDIQGDSEEGAHLKIKVEGELIVRLDRGYTVSMKAKGTLSMTMGDADDPTVKGEGPMTIEETSTLKE